LALPSYVVYLGESFCVQTNLMHVKSVCHNVDTQMDVHLPVE
jgi:hypothetical protein